MYDLQSFTGRVQELIRRVNPYDDSRRATMQDLATAINLSRPELSNRLHATKGAKLTARDTKAIVLILAEWGAITTQAEAVELLTMVDCPSFTVAEWQSPPLDLLTATAAAQPLTNLPLRLTSFVGREREMLTVANLLTETRLLTLIGEGGAGKTRLAIEVGERLLSRFDGGVWLVELAALRDGLLLVQAMTTVLGVKVGTQLPLDAVCAAVGDQAMLLILDNCEHLLTAAAGLTHELLIRCPALRILATSREALRTGGEMVLRLPALSLPAADPQLTVADLRRYQATLLFIERAHAANPLWALRDSEAAAVREVCERLDGIPLAIELAAARLRVLTIAQVAARLGDRFQLLTSGDRIALPRQQTLRALFDWSYDLLTGEEQALFRSLAVFNASFDAGAAASVVAPPVAFGLMADRLVDLAEKSLLTVEQSNVGPRYRLLETTREYATERLHEGGETAAMQIRHFAYYLALAATAEPELSGVAQAAWLDRLAEDHPNLRAALGCEVVEPVERLRLATMLWRFWMIRAYLSEGRRWLNSILAAAPHAPELLQAKAYYGLGFLALTEGDDDAAEGCFQQAVAIQERLGDLREAAKSRNGLGIIASNRGDFTTARLLFEQNLAYFRSVGERDNQAVLLNNLGALAWLQADYEAARQYLAAALIIFTDLGDEHSIASATNNLGQLAHKQGDIPAAVRLLTKSLRLHHRLQNVEPLAGTLDSLAVVYIDTGEHQLGVLAALTAERVRVSNNLTANPDEEMTSQLVHARMVLGEAEFAAQRRTASDSTLAALIERVAAEPTVAPI